MNLMDYLNSKKSLSAVNIWVSETSTFEPTSLPWSVSGRSFKTKFPIDLVQIYENFILIWSPDDHLEKYKDSPNLHCFNRDGSLRWVAPPNELGFYSYATHGGGVNDDEGNFWTFGRWVLLDMKSGKILKQEDRPNTGGIG